MSAWPAFADVMTILFVVSLAVAAHAINNVLELQEKLKKATERIEEPEDPKPPGHPPCLEWEKGPPTTFVPLGQITVAAPGAVSFLSRSLEGNPEIRSIPRLEKAVEQGQMSLQEFEGYANAFYQYGKKDDTFEGDCRFYIELKQGGDDPLAFSRVYGMVTKYLLISNPAEVIEILVGKQ